MQREATPTQNGAELETVQVKNEQPNGCAVVADAICPLWTAKEAAAFLRKGGRRR